MKLNFSKEDVKGILENYYREYEDFNGVVNVECKAGTGFCLNEYYDKADLAIEAVGKLNVFGREVPMVRKISKEEVEKIFRTSIETQGYMVSGVTFDYGIDTTVVGYGMMESVVKEGYFNGICVSVKNKSYVKKGEY